MTNLQDLVNWLDTVRIDVSDEYPGSKTIRLFAHSKEDETMTANLNISFESRKTSRHDSRFRREFDRFRRGGSSD